MKKLLIILALLVPFWVLAQNRPLVDADLLDGFDSQFFLDTLDFDVTKTWYVDVNYDGTCWSCPVSNGTIMAPYTTIQTALDEVVAGDIVLVYPGTYAAEHLSNTIDSVRLLSLAGPEQTFVTLTASSLVGFDVDAENMTISGFTFTMAEAGYLIQLEGGEDGFTLKNCILDTDGSPTIGLNIGASGCSNMTVENNKFISETDNGAIWLQKNVSNSLIRNNWFVGADSSVSYAIQSAGSTGGRYIGNLIEGYASGIFLHTVTAGSGGTANELIANNIIRNCGNAIRLGHNTQTVDMDSMFVFNNTLYYNSFAIFIADDANVLSGTFEVVGNNINDNTVSIRNNGDVPVYLANWIDGAIVAGASTFGDITIEDATPQLSFKDTDATAGDINANIQVNATDVGDGTEDIDFQIEQQVNGTSLRTYFSDADVGIYLYPLGEAANPLAITTGGDVDVPGTLDAPTLNTGQGDNELYAMDQDVQTGDDPTFNTVTLTNQSTEATYDIINNSELQNSLVGGFYHYDGIDDGITTINSANLSPVNGQTLIARIRSNVITGTQHRVVLQLRTTSNNTIQLRYPGDGNTFPSLSGKVNTVLIEEDYSDITIDTLWHSIALVMDGTSYSFYQDGVFIETSPEANINTWAGATPALRIGFETAENFSGDIAFVIPFNYALTASQINEISRWDSENPPIWFSDVGASQTEQTSGTLTIGKRYRINDWITNDDFVNVGGTNVDGNEFIATGTTPDVWTNSSTVVSIGVVGNWNGSGIGHNTWADACGNDIYATVSGAIYTNIPNEDTETVRQDGITDDTQILSSSNLVPDGYVLKYVIGTEVVGNTATLDLGTSAGGSQVFSQQVFTASTVTPVAVDFFNLTGSDVALYLNDDGAGTWNSGELNMIFVLQKIR